MQTELYMEILGVDSTSSKEAALADLLAQRLRTPANTLEVQEVGDGTRNLFFQWGTPKLVFCTHMDTVPPYIPPTVEGDIVRGRGTCDAKGQIAAMWEACRRLESEGCTDFGLLLLAGEETGSFGAKAFNRTHSGMDTVIVGEPTDGCMVSASKGTKSFSICIRGEAFHSGYPQYGASAVMRFNEFVNDLKAAAIPQDGILGETTWNIGLLHSDNPQNILSPELSFRLYFRTTFASDAFVSALIPQMAQERPWMSFEARGGDTPMTYSTIEGIPTTTVSFGSDAPQLGCFSRRMLMGAGSILTAHRADECVRISQLEDAASKYVEIYKTII